jgi:hypothetical protein
MEEVRREAAAAAGTPPSSNPYAAQLTALRAFRASRTPAQLGGQAREGYTSATPPAPVDRLPKLVRIDPSLPRDPRDPNRIRLIEVHYSGRSGTPYATLMERVAETLDWSALEALVRPLP